MHSEIGSTLGDLKAPSQGFSSTHGALDTAHHSQQQGATFRRLCQDGNVNLVSHMLQSGGFDVNATQADGCTGLWLAAEQGYADIVKLLSKHRANMQITKQPGDVTPLYVAAQNGHTAVVQALLEEGVAPNTPKATGATPLYIAAQQNFVDIAELLIRHGANLNITNHQGISPLMIAAFQGNLETVRLLLMSGADAHQVGGGRNAVEWAEANGHGNAVQRIVDQIRDEKAREAEARQLALHRPSDVVPQQQPQQPDRVVVRGEGFAQSPYGGGATGGDRFYKGTQAAADTNWYTPKYLVRGVAPPSASYPSPQRTGTSPTPSTYRPSPAGGSKGLPLPSSPTPLSAAGFPCAGGVNPKVIEDEMKRNAQFRSQISKTTALNLLESSAAGKTIPRAALYEVDQEWQAFKVSIASQEELLQQSKHEVQNGWMLSAASMIQYEDSLRSVRQQHFDAMKKLAEKEAQDKRVKNGFSYPPLPEKGMEALKQFAQVGEAKGPIEPPKAAEAPAAAH